MAFGLWCCSLRALGWRCRNSSLTVKHGLEAPVCHWPPLCPVLNFAAHCSCRDSYPRNLSVNWIRAVIQPKVLACLSGDSVGKGDGVTHSMAPPENCFFLYCEGLMSWSAVMRQWRLRTRSCLAFGLIWESSFSNPPWQKKTHRAESLETGLKSRLVPG